MHNKFWWVTVGKLLLVLPRRFAGNRGVRYSVHLNNKCTIY